jgi:pantothenate kinase
VADPAASCRADDLESWIRERATGVDRYLVGIAGPPGSGKSTSAMRLGVALGAPVVPMDGFHLSNATLRSRGLLAVKGAPETFDAAAFVELVRALRDRSRTVQCPAFDRTTDEPVANRIHVVPDDVVVLVEGNYLLLDQPPWSDLAGLFDSVAYLDLPVESRRQRLIARHVEFGRDPADAAEFVQRSDEANATLVEASRPRADLLVRAG